jgi:deazaflavin-dependent oxidoreductase (nitroreductase family)
MNLKWRMVTTFQRWVLNPVTRLFAGTLSGLVLLETTGRRSGLPRRTPVGGHLDGGTLWIVAEHGSRANYVKNIQAHPEIRVRISRTWRTGTASILRDDDPRQRLRATPNDLMVRLVGTDLTTVRVDLDPISREALA